MHSSIVISAFLIYAAALSLGGFQSLVFGSFILFIAYLMLSSLPGANALAMLKRLRWILVSIFVVYLWFTPGEPLTDGLRFISREGLLLALERCGVLVLIVLAVELLLRRLDQQGLLKGLYWLTRPLQFFGINQNRIILRIALTLQLAMDMKGQAFVVEGEKRSGFKGRLLDMASALSQRFHNAVDVRESNDSIEVDIGHAPGILSWWFPVALAAAFLVVEKWI